MDMPTCAKALWKAPRSMRPVFPRSFLSNATRSAHRRASGVRRPNRRSHGLQRLEVVITHIPSAAGQQRRRRHLEEGGVGDGGAIPQLLDQLGAVGGREREAGQDAGLSKAQLVEAATATPVVVLEAPVHFNRAGRALVSGRRAAEVQLLANVDDVKGADGVSTTERLVSCVVDKVFEGDAFCEGIQPGVESLTHRGADLRVAQRLDADAPVVQVADPHGLDASAVCLELAENGAQRRKSAVIICVCQDLRFDHFFLRLLLRHEGQEGDVVDVRAGATRAAEIAVELKEKRHGCHRGRAEMLVPQFAKAVDEGLVADVSASRAHLFGLEDAHGSGRQLHLAHGRQTCRRRRRLELHEAQEGAVVDGTLIRRRCVLHESIQVHVKVSAQAPLRRAAEPQRIRMLCQGRQELLSCAAARRAGLRVETQEGGGEVRQRTNALELVEAAAELALGLHDVQRCPARLLGGQLPCVGVGTIKSLLSQHDSARLVAADMLWLPTFVVAILVFI
eukprot:scaffold7341_cov229-Pinguiococcus_pyrenoidosus.AAC.7